MKDSGGEATPILKSALKKPNQSTETLSLAQGGRVVYNDQTFAEAAYPPPLARTAKSIPNISFNENVDTLGRDRPLSLSSNTLDADYKGTCK